MAEEKKQSYRLRLWLWRSLAVVLILVFFATRYMLRTKLTVRAAQVGREALSSTNSTDGRVEPENNYQFFSPMSTTVKAIYVQPGDKVPAGKLLMVLDDTDARARVASAESAEKAAQASLDAALHSGTQEQQQMSAADLARAQLEQSQAQHDLDALTKLNQAGAASAGEVSGARARLQSAQAAVFAAQQSATNRYSSSEIARARAAVADAQENLAAARHVLAQTVLRAPIAGTVFDIQVARTAFAEQGRLLLQMADLSHERVRAYFDEPDIGHLQDGQSIVIKWDAKPGREWRGHIERIPITVVTYGNRHVGEALIGIDGPDGGLLPDTNVNITVTTSSDPNSLSIPREALFSLKGQTYVFKIVGNTLVRTPVTTGIVNLTHAAIISGLQQGDWVARGTTTGQPLQEGVSIKVVK